MHHPEPNFEILLVEDNPGDAILLQDLFKHSEHPARRCNIRWLMNSTDVIPYLRSPEMAHRPDLIIVDYKMPLDGGRAIAELKGDPDYRHIPVIVLTGTRSPSDICDVYRRGANCCYQKPSGLDEYDALVQAITEHWLGKACIPVCRESATRSSGTGDAIPGG